MTFYYKAYDRTLMAGTSIGANPNLQNRKAVKYEITVIVIFGAIFATGYLLLGEAKIPIQAYKGAILTFAGDYLLKGEWIGDKDKVKKMEIFVEPCRDYCDKIRWVTEVLYF